MLCTILNFTVSTVRVVILYSFTGTIVMPLSNFTVCSVGNSILCTVRTVIEGYTICITYSSVMYSILFYSSTVMTSIGLCLCGICIMAMCIFGVLLCFDGSCGVKTARFPFAYKPRGYIGFKNFWKHNRE